MAKFLNSVRVTTVTTGMGTVTLGPAFSNGFATFGEGGAQSGDKVTYVIQENQDYEIGVGTYNSSGPTLTRDTVYMSKIGGVAGTAKMNLAGNAEVRATVAAEDLQWMNFKESQIASAATTDIGAANNSRVEITGTTTITSLGTRANLMKFVRFAGALVLTHNATSLILPGGSTLTTAAGDTAVFVSDASGNWRCAQYTRAADSPDLLVTGLAKRVRVDAAQSFTASEQEQGRRNISAALKGHLFGLTLSNNATDVVNDIDVASGEAASTGANPILMVLASAMTKRLDAAWSAGSGNGGRFDSATFDGTWHVFLISNGSITDVGFCTLLDPTPATNYPAGYSYRRIGSIVRSGGALYRFTQVGDEFLLETPPLDVNATNPGTSAVTRTLTVPTGINVVAHIMGIAANTGAAGTTYALFSALDTTDALPGFNNTDTGTGALQTGYCQALAVYKRIKTNTSGQIRSRVSYSDGNVSVGIRTIGWTDGRGRLA